MTTKSHKPKITVLLCTYNCESSILMSLKSILWQDFQDFEILILDDASSDGTRKVLEEIDDDRIKKIFFKKNRGQTYNLNFGTRIARGDYIAFLDVGDIWFPNFLSKMINATSDGTHFAYCWTSGQNPKCHLSTDNNYADFLYQGRLADTITLFISKDATKKVKFQAYKDGGYLKDDAFTLSASKIYKVKLVPEELSVKLETSYDNGVNVSRNFLRSAHMALDYYQSIEKDVYKYCGYLGLSRHNYILGVQVLYSFEIRWFFSRTFLAIYYYLLSLVIPRIYKRKIRPFSIFKSISKALLIGFSQRR